MERFDIPFGGSYRECWSEEHVLTVQYEGRRFVGAVRRQGRWEAQGGDEALAAQLSAEDCPALTAAYFRAAARVRAALARCERLGLPPAALHECARFTAEPLAAAELMRALMDDRGLGLEEAYQTVAACCDDLRSSGVDVEEVYPLQPRTAHVVNILRSCAATMPALAHDSSEERFRSPLGAVREGERLRLSLDVLSGQVERAFLLLWGDAVRKELPMARREGGFSVELTAPSPPAALWYCFRLETGSSAHWLCPDGGGHRGRLCGWEAGGFRLTVYKEDFETPAWFRRRVMYQIFPDRFAFSRDGTAEAGIAYHRALGQTPELHGSLDEPVRYQARSFESDYSPDDFYGGTLNGIREKLPYLKSLGVSCLYLNPIVEARSNHRYDCSDYLRVDPILGSEEDFARLCREAEALDIRILLDGVFSHTGADSIYFNREGHYPGPGACQGPQSPYYGWYDFKRFPDKYRCWWGFRDLPEVEESNESWQRFIIEDEDSVVRSWLRRGAAGWRLDVADELPDSVLSQIRRAAKTEKPDALILGEVWEDAVTKESYGDRRNYALGCSLDTVMNYPLRRALLDFIHRRVDAYGLRDFLIGQQMNYPKPLYYSLMNLLGSHDVERIRSALATDRDIRALPRQEQLALDLSQAELDEALEREKLCAAVQFSLPGVPSIYYGDEQGMSGVCDPFNRLPFQEGERDLYDYYAALAARRNGAAALSTGEARFMAAGSEVLLILRYIQNERDCFGLEAENGAFLTVVNRGTSPVDYRADCAAAGRGVIRGRIDAGRAEIIQI